MQKLRPIVIDEKGFALGGNQRLKALRELGADEVFIIRAENLTEAQKKEFLARDNISLGEWDFAILEEDFEIPELKDFGFSQTDLSQVFTNTTKSSQPEQTFGIYLSFASERELKTAFETLREKYECKIIA